MKQKKPEYTFALFVSESGVIQAFAAVLFVAAIPSTIHVIKMENNFDSPYCPLLMILLNWENVKSFLSFPVAPQLRTEKKQDPQNLAKAGGHRNRIDH